MNDKLRALLGFARKAGRLAVGTAKATESVKRGRSKLVLTASDISAKSAKEMRFICEKHGVTARTTALNIDEITASIGTRAGILSIEDEGFAAAVIENL